MGRFIANQKLDEAGVVGVALRKLLVLFMVIDFVWLVFGASFFSAFMSFLFHAVVLMGVYRRRTAVLLLYVVFNVIGFILVALALLLVLAVVMNTPNGGQVSEQQYSYSTYNDAATFEGVSSIVRRSLPPVFLPSNSTSSDSSSSSSSSSESSSASASSSSSDSYSSSSEEADQAMFFIAMVAVLFSLVLLYCKICSVVLAHKMRKILLANQRAPVLPVNVVVPSAQESEAAPLMTNEDGVMSFDEAGHPPVFNYPGFVPYQHPSMMMNPYPGFLPTNNIQGDPAMMPPPFMYGQHPVFYTFAPPPQNPTNDSNEKL